MQNRSDRSTARALSFPFFFLAVSAFAAPGDSNDEFIRQQQRERALQQREEKAPDVRLESPELKLPTDKLPTGETPCFQIDRVILIGESAERFAWALAAMNRNNRGQTTFISPPHQRIFIN